MIRIEGVLSSKMLSRGTSLDGGNKTWISGTADAHKSKIEVVRVVMVVEEEEEEEEGKEGQVDG